LAPANYTVQTATATLLGPQGGGQVDLSEPVPFNQSQLLYNQPIADPAKSFERYADTNKGGAPRSSAKFNQSLNDREPFKQTLAAAEVDVDTSLAKIEDEVKNLSNKKSTMEDEYRPKNFTKAASKQEPKTPPAKMEKGGIQPDPTDIDGAKDEI
jgi:hypothetical protein